jgi:hypothetical protein
MIRGSNPVWSFVDLNGKQFDDTFYMYVLQNDLPYIPSPVWHDPDGNVPWTNPIQFLGNGTLPVDIYFDPTVLNFVKILGHYHRLNPILLSI